MRFLPLFALPLLAATAAPAQGPAVHVSGWARATVPGQTASAAYLTIHNAERTGNRLVAVITPAAAKASIHITTTADGVVRMRPAGAVPVGPSQLVEMKPGGLHVMLTGLKTPLRVGQQLPLTLRFARGGIVRTSVPIRLQASDAGHRH
jgi:copper(I)-binding protein